MLTLQDHIRDFLAAKQQENLALNTLSYYQSALSKFADYLRDEEDGSVSVEALSAAHIRGYIDTLQDDLSPGGVHARLRALRVFFNWLVEDDVLTKSPMKRVKLPRVPQESLPVVSQADFKKLLKAAKASSKPLRDEAILKTLYDCGLRASELTQLCVKDVLSGGYLYISQGKGQKDRTVLVSRDVTKAIHRYVKQERTDSDVPILFLGHDETPLTRSGLLKLLNRLSDEARIERKSPHAFRRGFVVSYLTNEGDPFSAKRILGHTSMAMVDRYAAMGTEDLKEIHRRASPLLKVR